MMKICEHHLQGKCTRGDKCRFSHEAAPASAPAAAAPPSTSSNYEPPLKICEHHLQGKCTRGAKCRFSHAAAPASAPVAPPSTSSNYQPPVKICEHHLQGKCTRGDKCRFSHEAAPAAAPAAASRKVSKEKKSTETCTHYLNGTCTRGEVCRYVHPADVHGEMITRKRAGLQGRQKRKDWLRYGAKIDNVYSVIKADVGLVHMNAPLCTGHNAKCAMRKVDKPTASRYGKPYWCCHKVVTGQTQDNCGFFRWVKDEELVSANDKAESSSSGRDSKRRKFDEDDDEAEGAS